MAVITELDPTSLRIEEMIQTTEIVSCIEEHSCKTACVYFSKPIPALTSSFVNCLDWG